MLYIRKTFFTAIYTRDFSPVLTLLICFRNLRSRSTHFNYQCQFRTYILFWHHLYLTSASRRIHPRDLLSAVQYQFHSSYICHSYFSKPAHTTLSARRGQCLDHLFDLLQRSFQFQCRSSVLNFINATGCIARSAGVRVDARSKKGEPRPDRGRALSFRTRWDRVRYLWRRPIAIRTANRANSQSDQAVFNSGS